jgi:hypothetical protein
MQIQPNIDTFILQALDPPIELLKSIRRQFLGVVLLIFKDIGFKSMKVNENNYLRITIRYGASGIHYGGKASIGYQTTITFLLDNNESIEISFEGLTDSWIADGMQVRQERDILISPENYKLLTNHKVTAVRVKAQMNPFDFDILPEKQDVISKMLKCVG